MSELVAFLEARLAEDEALAEEAAGTGSDWTVARDGTVWVLHDPAGSSSSGLTGPLAPFAHGVAEHMSHHDPARVLREVTAKRAILAKYQRAQAAYEQMVNPASTAAVFALAEVVQHMATVYEDHPDFQEQWR